MRNNSTIERARELGKFVSDTHATVRFCAKVFGISKSTVHKDLTYKLPLIDPVLYNAVKLILDDNLANRHIRGGEATKRKYKSLKISRSVNESDKVFAKK